MVTRAARTTTSCAAIPRPGHADYPAWIKYRNWHDVAGGGHFSGRLTAPLCIVGGIALQALEGMGIHIAAHIAELGPSPALTRA